MNSPSMTMCVVPALVVLEAPSDSVEEKMPSDPSPSEEPSLNERLDENDEPREDERRVKRGKPVGEGEREE